MNQNSNEIKVMVSQVKKMIVLRQKEELVLESGSWKSFGKKSDTQIEIAYYKGVEQGLVLAISQLIGYTTEDVNLMIRNWEKFND